MTFGEKLVRLRKENHYTQEQLAEQLGVSRQAVSKWESNTTFPETEKLIKISQLFHCSLDYLLQPETETEPETTETAAPHPDWLRHFSFPEKKSTRTLFGLPLWQIGKTPRAFFALGVNAKGVFAVGVKATGLVTLGALSIGILSFGVLALGLIAIGLWSLGVLAIGSIAIGVLVIGALSVGIFSIGALSVGDFSIGALAIGKYFAMGDHAKAAIALGNTRAVGTIMEKLYGANTAIELTPREFAAVKAQLDAMVPAYLNWAKSLVYLFL